LPSISFCVKENPLRISFRKTSTRTAGGTLDLASTIDLHRSAPRSSQKNNEGHPLLFSAPYAHLVLRTSFFLPRFLNSPPPCAMWKAIRFDVPLKTTYSWYQPHKREAMNANDKSPRISSTSPPRGYDPERGHVGALPAMRHATFRHHHPKMGHEYRHENTNTPYSAFLNKQGQEGTHVLDTSVSALYNCV